MGTHSFHTSPSRRGRRIFDFGTESLMRAAGGGGPFCSPGIGGPAISGPGSASLPSPQIPLQMALLSMMNMNGVDPTSNILQMIQTCCTVCATVCASKSELAEHLKTHSEIEKD